MQFLRRHFEKIILSAVLAGLGAAAYWLFVAVTEAKRQPGGTMGSAPHAKPWEPVDLGPLRGALKGLTDAPPLSLSDEHNLFNPVTWKMRRDGWLFKQTKEGPTALTVTDIRPLYYTIRLDKVLGESFSLIAKHAFGPEKKWVAMLNDKGLKTAPFPCVIVGTNAALENPATLQVLIPETKATNAITAKEPYKRVEGYEVDLKYNASDTNNVFLKKHVDDTLPLSGETYKIIAITKNAVTVQNVGTSKRDVREWNGGQ